MKEWIKNHKVATAGFAVAAAGAIVGVVGIITAKKQNSSSGAEE